MTELSSGAGIGTHAFTKCSALNRALDFPDLNADGIPMIPKQILVSPEMATCITCSKYASSNKPYSGKP